jgi:hypothetical protein
MPVPIVAYVGAAAAGAVGGIIVERIINPSATGADYAAAGAMGAIPGAGLGLRSGLAGAKQLNRFRKLRKAGMIPDKRTGALILSQKGTKFPYASGRPLVQPVIIGGAVQYIATAAYGRAMSRGGEHTASSGTPVTRKSMRGPSAQRKAYFVTTDRKAISGHKLGTRGPCDKGYVLQKKGRRYMCVPRK